MMGGSKACSRIRCIRRSDSAGFTIVEVMIVLAVTGLLFVSAAIMIGGRQNQAEFNHGVQQIQSQIQQVVNEVSSGYYPNLGDFKCERSGTGLTLSNGSNAQGTNSDCIFLGKVIQFGSGVAGTDPEKIAVHSLAALRTDSTGAEILVLKDAAPTVINNAAVNATVLSRLEGGLNTDNMWYNNKTKLVSAVAIVSSLGQATSTGLLAGSQKINIIPIDGTALTDDQSTVIARVNAFLRTAAITPNPTNGVQVCFASGGTNQSGLLTIGSSGSGGRELEVTLDLKPGRTC